MRVFWNSFGLTLLLALFLPARGWAQLDNSALVPDAPDLSFIGKKEVSIQLEHLNFLRNNEYFLPIADGYTLFGYQLMPKAVYNVNGSLFLEGGMFLRKDYGKSGYKEVEPMFTARYKSGRHEVLLGNLDGGFAHGLIEPLYNFENQLIQRLESGNQWKFHGRRSQLDAWVDWRHMIYDYSPTQEEVWGGFSGSTVLLGAKSDSATGRKEGFELKVPYQFTGYHKGGQIDTANLPLVTYFNAASGLESSLNWKEGFFKALTFKGYYLGFVDYSQQKKLPFKSGRGVFLNASVKTRPFEIMVSYWMGNDFTTWAGGKLYRSVSSSIHKPGYVERQRELLIFRLLQDIRISKELPIFISARLEPYLDLRAKKWEFSHGLFLSYRGQIWKSKPLEL